MLMYDRGQADFACSTPPQTARNFYEDANGKPAEGSGHSSRSLSLTEFYRVVSSPRPAVIEVTFSYDHPLSSGFYSSKDHRRARLTSENKNEKSNKNRGREQAFTLQAPRIRSYVIINQ